MKTYNVKLRSGKLHQVNAPTLGSAWAIAEEQWLLVNVESVHEDAPINAAFEKLHSKPAFLLNKME
jgi:hypothetical protein